jgi:hypothetical protein
MLQPWDVYFLAGLHVAGFVPLLWYLHIYDGEQSALVSSDVSRPPAVDGYEPTKSSPAYRDQYQPAFVPTLLRKFLSAPTCLPVAC